MVNLYMNSPFDTHNNHVILYLEPFLNTFYKTYQTIVTLSSMPSGPLSELVTQISTSKLSPFQNISPFSQTSASCLHVLLRYPKSSIGNAPSIKNPDYFMGPEDIPSIFSYLHSNGYVVDTQLTKILFKGNHNGGLSQHASLSGNKKMICMIRQKD